MKMLPKKKKQASIGELRTPVMFYEYVPNEGPEPGESEKAILYNSWAKIDSVWMKDLELAKSNGTLSDITITIRDPGVNYIPDNLHYIEIDSLAYIGKHYNVKHVNPDLQNKEFIKIIAGLKT